MAGVWEDQFLLYGPESVGVVDLLRVQESLQRTGPSLQPSSQSPAQSPPHSSSHNSPPNLDEVHHSTRNSPCNSPCMEPETVRNDNSQFDFDYLSQLDPPHSQNSLQNFSSLSPISPMLSGMTPSKDIEQSPTISSDHLTKHFLPSRIDTSDVMNTSILPPMRDLLSPCNDPLIFHDEDSVDVASSQGSSSISNHDNFNLESDMADETSTSIASHFVEKCRINEGVSMIVENDTEASKIQNMHPAFPTERVWKLPLRYIKNENNSKLKSTKQLVMCSDTCSSHSEHCDTSCLQSDEECSHTSCANYAVADRVSEKLDNLNSQCKYDTLDSLSLIFSYYNMKTYNALCDVLVEKSFQCHRSRQSARSLRTNKRLLVGGVLIVTSKKDIAFWENIINCNCSNREVIAEAKYHCYTDPLSKRRKFGAYRIAAHDIVLTTFDILRAKEVAIPFDEADSSSDSDDDICKKTSRGKLKRPENPRIDKWLLQRKDSNMGSTEMSNLHLIHWDRIIVDHRNLSNIRCGTQRGDAILSLKADSRISIVEQESEGVSLTISVLQDLSDFLEIRSDVLPDSYNKLD